MHGIGYRLTSLEARNRSRDLNATGQEVWQGGKEGEECESEGGSGTVETSCVLGTHFTVDHIQLPS